MITLLYRTAVSCGLILLLAACTGAQFKANSLMQQEGAIVEKLKQCLVAADNNPEFEPIKRHTEIVDLNKINYTHLSDPHYISKDEFDAAKKFWKTITPCKTQIFNELSNLYPGIALALVHADTKGMNAVNLLLSRNITWGQYNQKRLEVAKGFQADVKPYFDQIKSNLNMEHQQEMAVRQQIFNAMSAYAQAVNQANAAAYANRPLMTTCRAMGGWTSCVSN